MAKKRSESNQSGCAVSPVYVESGTERFSAIACPWGNLGF